MTKLHIAATADVLDHRVFDEDIIPQLEPFYRYLKEHQQPPPLESVRIDLSKVQFAYPYGALGIVLLCRKLHALLGRKVSVPMQIIGGRRFSKVTEAPIASWLNDLGFLGVMEDVAELSYSHLRVLLRPQEVSMQGRYIPVREFTSGEQLGGVLARLMCKTFHLLTNELGYSLADASRFYTVLSEVTQNITDHSSEHSSTPHGYVVAQAYRDNPYWEGLALAVMDLGIGIRESMGKKWQLKDDAEAIQKACQTNVTTKKDGGGLGLPSMIEIAKQTCGTLIIRSGRAKVSYSPESQYESKVEEVSYFFGTQVGFRLPASRLGM